MRRTLASMLFVHLTLGLCLSQPRFPDVGPVALYQHSMEARSKLTVLSVSLQPGFEDLASLAYFRLGKGARVMSAYLTNGEAGESDVRGEYPPFLAAARRVEATQAISQIGGEVSFLNVPDIAASSDSEGIRLRWDRDTVQTKLMRLISVLRPDIVLLSRDCVYGGRSLRWQLLRSDLVRAIQRLVPSSSTRPPARTEPETSWSVERMWADDGREGGIRVPIDETYKIWKMSYRTIGEHAAECYSSLREQRRLWRQGSADSLGAKPTISYRMVYPRVSKPPRSLDEGLPNAVSSRLGWIERELTTITGAILKGEKGLRSTPGRPESVLSRLSVLIDSVDFALTTSAGAPAGDRRNLLSHKLALEYLRCSLLGVQVRYALSDSIVTDRQISFLTIDTVLGIPAGGTTDIYFPFTERQWVINEASQNRMPIQFGTPYRLLSPQHLAYNYPLADLGVSRSMVWSTEMFFIIHKGAKREENFVARVSLPFLLAPRFTVEVLTPIVRVVPAEQLVVRVTNHSRDGVRDTLQVNDSLVVSTPSEFRLNKKDQSNLDTLYLTWKGKLPEGTFVFPVSIAGSRVGRFAARVFDAKVDSSKRVALVTGLLNSPLEDVLRRLSVRWDRIDQKDLADHLAAYQVVLIDRRALTLARNLRISKSLLDSYVERGGHVVILSQDASVWNLEPMVEGMHLASTPLLDERTPVSTDSTSRIITFPNVLENDSWTGWLNMRAHNILFGDALAHARVSLWTTRGKIPLIASWQRGQGTITYCDLALDPQFLNLHDGCYRLLANLISY